MSACCQRQAVIVKLNGLDYFVRETIKTTKLKIFWGFFGESAFANSNSAMASAR